MPPVAKKVPFSFVLKRKCKIPASFDQIQPGLLKKNMFFAFWRLFYNKNRPPVAKSIFHAACKRGVFSIVFKGMGNCNVRISLVFNAVEQYNVRSSLILKAVEIVMFALRWF